MVICGESGNTNMTDMDKLLEEYLMPPPDSAPRSYLLRNSTDSLRDASSSSLDRSGNSSSTNTSWSSSCSCHSMSALNRSAKSTFVFHKQSILPPLLCSSSRTEMKVYKIKAVEKEEKKKRKEKQRLISRVEAILSGVEISPMKNKSNSKKMAAVDTELPCKNEPNSSDDIISNHDNYCSDDELNRTYDNSSHSDNDDITIPHIEPESDDAIACHDNDDVIDPHNHNDDVTNFHDNAAYRSSLRNLLQKSMNQSGGISSPLGNSVIVDEKKNKEISASTKSSSESEEDVTETTVVEIKPKSHFNSDTEDQKICKIQKITKNHILDEKTSDIVHCDEYLPKNLILDEKHAKIEDFVPKLPENLEEDTLVNSIVQSALERAKNVLLNDNNRDSLLQNNNLYDITNRESFEKLPQNSGMTLEHENTIICPKKGNFDEISSWETPNVKKIEISPLSILNSHFFELHNQSTSTKVNFPLGGTEEQICGHLSKIDQEIEQSPILANDTKISNDEIVELAGEICFGTTIAEPCPVTMAIVSDACHFAMTTPGGPNTETTVAVQFPDTTNATTEANDDVIPSDDLTMLQPVMSDTVSNVTMTSSLLKEPESIEIDDETMKENCDPAMETGSLLSMKRSLSYTLEKPSKEYESAVIEAVSQHFQGFQNNMKEDTEMAAVKKKKILQARVRRGSYTVDEPSPYLINNKENITIGPEDDDVCSETNTADVKRKLDLPSDSEESSIVPPRSTTKKQDGGNVSNAELNVVNLCRILQDQHKQQMEIMKKKHEEQLQSLQHELVLGKNSMSLPLDAAIAQPFVLPNHDVTVSPSLASTEYKDIRVKDQHFQAQQPATEYTQHSHSSEENYSDSTPVYQDVSQHHAADISRISDIKLTPTLHDKLCKLSALCKGHLTRELLGSNKVQDILQIIRDTSRLILSLRLEQDETKKMDSVRDTYLEDRLYNQLRSALYNLHNIFFDMTTRERMYIIAQSHVLNRSSEKKRTKPRTLSVATQKSLERKRILSTNSDSSHTPVIPHSRKSSREVKSKISHIWKTDPVKIPAKKSPTSTLPSKAATQNKKPSVTSQKTTVTSQNKTKGCHVTSQSKTISSHAKNMTSQNKNFTTQSKRMTSQSTNPNVLPGRQMMSQSKLKSPVKSQSNAMTSQSSKVTSQVTQNAKPTQRKTASSKRPIPLTNRGNIRPHT